MAGADGDPARPTLAQAAGHPIPALDGLRALSILLVMASHSGLQAVVPGVFGVTVFFFISGFLITTLIVAEHARSGTIDVLAFTMRRLLRLYPPLIAFVALSGAAWIASGGRLDPLGVLGALAYLTNYLVIHQPDRIAGLGGQLWSLAVEEHFYLVYPLLMLALLRRRALVAPVLIAICAASLAIRIRVDLTDPVGAALYTGTATECRIDAILFGALAALFRGSRAGRALMGAVTHPAVVGLSIAALLASLLIRDPSFRNTVRYTLQGLALAAPILALTSTERYAWARALLDSRGLVAVGILSYSLYLWHLDGLALGEAAARALGWPYPAAVAIGWCAAFAFAILSYRIVERPFFALRRRFGSHVGAKSEAPAAAKA